MNKRFGRLLSAGILLVGGAAVLAASVQVQTPQPGQPTQARVWIQNQGQTEAVPVSIEDVASETPLRVEVTRVARQLWEYRDVSITAGQDPVAVLNSAGVDGWETTGLFFPGAKGTTVVMKRPR